MPSSRSSSTTVGREYTEIELQNMVDRILYPTTLQDPASLTPVFILNSTALPAPTAVNYNLLLPRLLAVIRHTGDYSVVFFAGGSHHRPSWPWMIHAYSTLDRDIRKSLKRLYIVHENWWVRTIIDTVTGAVGGKFRSKVVHVPNLTALGRRLNICALQIPLAVYDHDRRLQPAIDFPQTPVFGHDLVDDKIPSFWYDCRSHLSVEALYTEGIFRISPRQSHLGILREAFDRGQVVDLGEFGPHVVAASLKLFLRLLPTPPLPYSLMQQFPDFAATLEDTIKVANVLSSQTIVLLNDFVPLLRNVAMNEHTTRMSVSSLSRCITPSLIRIAAPVDDTMPISPAESLVTLVPSASDDSVCISDPLEIARVVEWNSKLFECIIYYWYELPIAAHTDSAGHDDNGQGRINSRTSSSSTLKSLGHLPPPLPSRKFSAAAPPSSSPTSPGVDAEFESNSPTSSRSSVSPSPEFSRLPSVPELEDGAMSKSVTFSYSSKPIMRKKSAPSLIQSRRGSTTSSFSYSSSSSSSIKSSAASLKSLSSLSSAASINSTRPVQRSEPEAPFIPVPSAAYLLQSGRTYSENVQKLPKTRVAREGKENVEAPPLPPKVKAVKPRGRLVEELTRLYEERMQGAEMLVAMGRRSASA